MKKFKKFTAVALAAAMATSILGGCGDNAVKESTGKVESGTVDTDKLDYVKLKMISVGDPETKPSEVFLEKVNEMLLEDLNCEVEIQYLTFAEQATKYPLVVSSGEDFDIIFTANWTSYADNARKGAYMELTEDMLKTYSLGYYELAKDRLDNIKVDGKMYMYVQTQKDYNNNTFMAIRGDIMKEAGLNDITTGAELETYLDYVAENKSEMNVLNVNGQDPYWSSTTFSRLLGNKLNYIGHDDINNYVVGWYSGFAQTKGPYILDTSDSANLKYIDQNLVDEEFLTFYSKAKEMQQKGYWDADVLSKTGNREEYYVIGNGAAAVRQLAFVDQWVYQLNQEHPEYDARMIKILDGNLSSSAGVNGAAIGANSKNWERAMMVCDKFISDIDYVNLVQYGLEGIHYTVNDDGTYHIIDNPEYAWSEPTHRSFLSSLIAETDTHTDAYYQFIEDFGAGKAFTPTMLYFSFDKSNVENEVAAMQQVNDNYLPIFAEGLADDIDALYKEYKAALENVGLQKYLDEYLKQAQEFYNSLN